MSILSEAIVCIGEVIKFVLERTLDLICLALAVGAMAVPWRAPFAIGAVCDALSNDSFREESAQQFFCSMVDVVTVPLGLVALINPWRLFFVLKSYCEAFGDDSGGKFNWKLRGMFWLQFWASLFDFIAVPLGLLALINPWRLPYALQSYWRVSADSKDGDKVSYNFELRTVFMAQFCVSIMDLILFPFFVFAAVVRPYALFPKLRSSDNSNDFFIVDFDKRFIVLEEAVLSVLDLFFVPVVLIVSLAPWRAQVSEKTEFSHLFIEDPPFCNRPFGAR